MQIKINRTIRFTKKYAVSILIACILVFISEAGYLRYHLIPSDIIRGVLSVILFGGVSYLVLKATHLDDKIVCWLCGMLLIFLHNSAYIKDCNLIFLVSYIAMLGICQLATYEITWTEKYFSMSMVVYLFFAFCTIAFYFLPDFYLQHVVELFPDTKEYLIKWYLNGCMAGLTEHYSTNGMFMATGCIMSVAALLKENASKSKSYILIALFLIALLLTGKRAHIVFVFIAVITMYFFWLSDNKKKRLKKLVLAVMVGGIVLMLLINMFPQLGVVLDRFKSVQYELSADGGGRGTLWHMAIEVFKEHPVLGIGWGNFRALTYGKLKWAEQAHVHNTYLQLLAETGVIGFGIYLSWFCYMFHLAAKELEYMKKYRKEDSLFLIAFSLGYQVFFYAYCMTGNPLYQYETYIPYYAACAIAIYYHKRNQRIRYEQRKKLYKKYDHTGDRKSLP